MRTSRPCRAHRPAGSRWPRRASATRGTPSRRCARFAAPWPVRRSCRSTRSTCCSARTTCRCSPGWVPTTSSCCAGPRRRRRGASWSTGRTSRRSCRSTCGRTCGTGCAATATRGTSGWGCPSAASWSTPCSPRSPSADRRRPATSTTGCRARGSTGAGTGRRPRRRWSTSSSPASSPSPRRNPQFERRLRPARAGASRASVLAAPEPTVEEAGRELVRRAAAAHGVGTELCLRDYFRMRPVPRPGAAVADARRGRRAAPGPHRGLGPAGLPAPRRRAAPQGATPGRCSRPFDPVVWERERTEQLFGFRYRIEIYVPAASGCTATTCCRSCSGTGSSRRVDLKADRRGRRRCRCWARTPSPTRPRRPPAELAAELAELGRWLGLDAVDVHPRGDLAAELAVAVEAL